MSLNIELLEQSFQQIKPCADDFVASFYANLFAYLTGANLKNAKVSDYELSNAFLEGAIMPDGSKYRSEKIS